VLNVAVLNRRVRTLRALPVLGVALLAGCGVAGTQFHPGVAAQVGDETITTRHVDQLTDDACQALQKLNQDPSGSGSQPTPLRVISRQVTSALIDRAAAEQLADDYDVTTTSDYKTNLAQTEEQLSAVSGAQKDAVLEVVEAQAYSSDVLVQIGEIELKKQGTDDSTPQEQYAEGQKVLAAWEDDHDVDVNPKYGIDPSSDDEVDTSLSVAVGTSAKAGLSGDPDASYTDALPGSLVCFD
jgi:peptidyl-prolyl cis-trans isomerase SurA